MSVRVQMRSLAVILCALCLFASACSNSSDDGSGSTDEVEAPESTDQDADEDSDTAEPETASVEFGLGLDDDAGHAETVEALTQLSPADTRWVVALDTEALVTAALLSDGATQPQEVDPLIGEILTKLAPLLASVTVGDEVTSAVLGYGGPEIGTFLLAKVQSEAIDEIAVGAEPNGTYGPADWPLVEDTSGNSLTVLPGGVLIVGTQTAVELVLDTAAGTAANDGPLAPFYIALDGDSHISFAYGLPALFDEVAPAATLQTATVVSGTLDLTAEDFDGELTFHTPTAEEFVTTYNALNLPSTAGEDPAEESLVLADPLVDELGRVVIPISRSPLIPSDEELFESRNLFRKLFADMEALDYANAVADRTSPPWLDLVVRSEADGGTQPSPGSVFIRWEFRDEEARATFEENELPAGFKLAPTQFLERDDPEGEYFLALNLYNAGGGSIVDGARAEWDVFVQPPDGADPDAGARPRFFVVDALAEEVSADPKNLLTPAEPVSHSFVDGEVVTDVDRFDGDGRVDVFASSFPVPDPATAEVARFTREMAIGNDYIYWAHGVYDQALYNATTFNHDAYFVDPEALVVSDDSPWAQYLSPDVKDAVYYVNTLEYVASPMANLDSDTLDITPEWLAELVGFTTNGHQSGLMRTAVEQSFRGAADPLVATTVTNEVPATYYSFEVTDRDGLEASLGLPAGVTLAPTTLYIDGTEAHYLTLAVYQEADAIEGTRAEWSVYVDDDSGRPPHLMVVELMTEAVAFDPYNVFNLPDEVSHTGADGSIRTQLSSGDVSFDLTFETSDAVEREVSLDWVEAGDSLCSLNNICNSRYYGAETLDVPVQLPTMVSVNEFKTPWDAFISDTPEVFFRTNSQQFAVKRWNNLDVVVDEAAFSGLEEPTHTISGSGTLIGRTSGIADSEYTYTGDAVLDGDQLTFAIDQEIINTLGVGNIFTTGTFDLSEGTGTQTVIDCQGPALQCSDVVNGSTSLYEAQGLDASDTDAITWQLDLVVDLGGNFGIADSSSTVTATALN